MMHQAGSGCAGRRLCWVCSSASSTKLACAVREIERARRRLVLHPDRLAAGAGRPFKAHLTPQLGDGAAGDVEAFPPQLPPDLARAITRSSPRRRTESRPWVRIPLLPAGTEPGRVTPLGEMVVIGRRGDRGHAA